MISINRTFPNALTQFASRGSPSAHPIAGSSWAIPVALAFLVLATRLPVRSRLLFNWDAANFALALGHYDVRLHQPHPPGYILFVSVGRLLQSVVGDANTSLVLESLGFSVVAVVLLFVLGREWFDPTTGLIAGLLLAASVTFWSYGGVALSYTSLACLTTAIVWLAGRAREGRVSYILLGVMYGLSGGFRAELLVFMLPVLSWALWRQPVSAVLRTLVTAAAVVLLWGTATVVLSGGLDAYFAVLRAYVGVDVVQRYAPTVTGGTGLLRNVRDTVSYVFYALYALFPLVVVASIATCFRWRSWLEARALPLVLWVIPPLAFYLLVHVGDPGYVFSLLPGLLLVSARFVTALPRSRRIPRTALLAGFIVPLLLANAAVFFLHQRPLTSWGVRQNDQILTAKLDLLRQYPPQETLVLTYESQRQLQFYAPGQPYLRWVDLTSPEPQRFEAPPGVTHVLLMDQSLLAALDRSGAPSATAPVPGALVLAVKPGQALVYRAPALRFEP